jgi:hypothetical protein
MLQHGRHVLHNWRTESRENRLRTARELLVCTHAGRCREDLVFHDWLPRYLENLKDYNSYGDFSDPELSISVARSVVNISSSEESHLFFVHEQNYRLHLRMFREPWNQLERGEVMMPEAITWVFHLAKLRTHEEAPRLGLAILCNLTTSPRLAITVYSLKGLDIFINHLASLDVTLQRLAAAAIWNLSKNQEIMLGIQRFLNVSDTLERLASKGVPMQRPPSSVLMAALPSILREATVNFGDMDCSLGGEPCFALGVVLASTGSTMMVLKPLNVPEPDADMLSRANIAVTKNPQIDRAEARRRLLKRRAGRAKTEMALAAVAASRMSFEELREDLTSFGLDVNDMFDRKEMETLIVNLMLSDTTREALGMEASEADERAAERDTQAQMVTISDSTEKGLISRPPQRKE